MLRSEAVTWIKRKLSFRKNTVLDDQIVSALQSAQRVLEATGYTLPTGLRTPRPWFLEELDYELPLTEGNAFVDLPADFLFEMEDSPPYLLDSEDNKVFLRKVLKSAAEEGLATETGNPTTYYRVGDQLKVVPTPDADYSLFFSYHKKADLLTADIENAWLKYVPELIVGIAGEELAADLRDKVEPFQSLIVTGAGMLWSQQLDHENANRRTAIGVVR